MIAHILDQPGGFCVDPPYPLTKLQCFNSSKLWRRSGADPPEGLYTAVETIGIATCLGASSPPPLTLASIIYTALLHATLYLSNSSSPSTHPSMQHYLAIPTSQHATLSLPIHTSQHATLYPTIHTSQHATLYLTIHTSQHATLYLSNSSSPSTHPSMQHCTSPSIHPSMQQSTSPSTHPSMQLSTSPSIHPSMQHSVTVHYPHPSMQHSVTVHYPHHPPQTTHIPATRISFTISLLTVVFHKVSLDTNYSKRPTPFWSQ